MTIAETIAAGLDDDLHRIGRVHERGCNAISDPAFDPEARPCECGEPERAMRELDAKRAILAMHAGCGDGRPAAGVLAGIYAGG